MEETFVDAWYLLRCRENYWRTLQKQLSEKGLKTCCPLILERRKRRDKKNSFRLINYPAFPGYIFVRFNPALIHTTLVKKLPGAMDFVRFGNQIATVSQSEIDALKMIQVDNPDQINIKIDTQHLREEFIRSIEKISAAENPAERIDLLFTMLANSKRPLRSNNAN